jgi:hypothetical protein
VGAIRGQPHDKHKLLPGPAGLLAAVLARAVLDARHPSPGAKGNSSQPGIRDQEAAISWLHSGPEVSEYADLLGLDGAWLRDELLRAAGLIEGTPRLGQRRRRHKPTTQSPRRT